MNLRCRPDFAFATLMQPYPGTRINEFCRERGLLDETATDHVPDSFFDRSVIVLPDRQSRERLRMLFALAIEFRFVRKFIRKLITLPLGRLYELLDKVWKGYCIKHREFPYSLTFREYLSSLYSFFRSRYY
jgi:hypothetical protein